MSTDRPKRPRGRPKSVAREHAVEVAMVSYWREGLHALSLNELCRRSGLSKPALYREFGGEDGLMAAALEHYRQLVVLPLLTVLAAERPFAETLDLVIVGMTTDHSLPAGCLFTRMRLSTPRLGPLTTAAVQAIRRERLEAIEAWAQGGLAAGVVDRSISSDLAARYIDTQLTMVLVQLATGEPPELIREQARLALRVLLSPGRGEGT